MWVSIRKRWPSIAFSFDMDLPYGRDLLDRSAARPKTNSRAIDAMEALTR